MISDKDRVSDFGKRVKKGAVKSVRSEGFYGGNKPGRNMVSPEIHREEVAYSVSPLTCDLSEPETYRVEEVSPPSKAYHNAPWLILDIDEEPTSGANGELEPLRLIIDRVETRPSGYIVHHTLQKPVSGTATESSSTDDKTASVLAGCGVIICILLMAVLVTISPLIAGTGPAAGFPALAATGISGAVSAPGHLTGPPQPLVGGADPAPIPVVVPAAGVPGAANSQVLPADTIPPQSAPQQPVLPKSYVTLQPVPAVLSPPLRDIRAGLPVPVADDEYLTIYSMNGQQAQANIPYVLFDLYNPPLVIDYTVTPVNISDVKELDYKIKSTRHQENVSLSRPYEQSWFRVIVRDTETTGVVLEDGYGQTYPQERSGQLVLYKSGKYRFEFSGGFAMVNLTMKVKKEGNIK
jgi:hypothetical protein